jgi:hypothetical protein
MIIDNMLSVAYAGPTLVSRSRHTSGALGGVVLYSKAWR